MIRAMLQRTFLVLLFLASFSVSAALIRGLVPERLKIEWFETVRQDADVIFVGSSHVFRQFDPALFDQQRGATTGSFRSYNLGAVGMEFVEEIYLLRKILEDKPENLRWIVAEAQPYDIQMRSANDFGNRRIGWHSTGITWSLLNAIQRSDLAWSERWDLIHRHVEHWWRRSINLARGLDVVYSFGKEPLEIFADHTVLGKLGDGYVPLDASTANQRNRAMNRKFKRAPGELLAARDSLPSSGDGGPPDMELLNAVRELEQLAASQGVGIVWWLHPNLERYGGWRQMLESGEIDHLIAHDDPTNYPQFYTVKWRFDLFHLNRLGAEILTTDFADQFVERTERLRK